MSAFPPVAELTPHAGPMLLVDRVVSAEGANLRCEVTISRQSIFFQRELGVPAYVGFEYMAQAISVYDGLKRRAQGKTPAIGFLLGCRKYSSARPYFAEGETLTVDVFEVLGGDTEVGMGSFDCRISGADGGELAKATINVYRTGDEGVMMQAPS